MGITIESVLNEITDNTARRAAALGRRAAFARVLGKDEKAKKLLKQASDVLREGQKTLKQVVNPQS